MEKEFKLQAYPINWPIGSGDRFCGVFHRPTNKVVLYDRKGGSKKGSKKELDLGDPELEDLVDQDLLTQLHEDVELLQASRLRSA